MPIDPSINAGLQLENWSSESRLDIALESETDGLPAPRRYIAGAALVAMVVLSSLDVAIANVALPTIANAFRVAPAASVWIVSAYQLAMVMALLPCAALGESIGYRRVFAAGVVLFTGASILCALSPTLAWLVAARFLQGLGGAAGVAMLGALLRSTYPRRLLGSAIGWNALGVALASAAGPALGAGIISVASWPWLFAINIPVCVVALLASRALPVNPGTKRPLDLISVALNAGVFGPLVIGVDRMTTRPWLAGGLLAVAAVSLVALVRRELPRKVPLIPLDLLRRVPFRVSVIASSCCFASQMAGYVALPFYLQNVLRQNAFTTGLYMTPWPLTVAIAAPFAGRLSDRVPSGWLCAAGGTCLAVGLAFAAVWPLNHSLFPLVIFTVFSGFGFGFFQTPNNRNMLLSAPRERSGAAGGMQGTARVIGQTAGAIFIALIFTLAPAMAAPRIGLGVAAILALAGGFISVLRIGR